MSRIKHDLDLLKSIIKRDNCKIKLINYVQADRDSIIYFTCNCGTECYKKFRTLYKGGGAFCKKCTKNTSIINLQNTLLERYGVVNASQLNDFNDKVKRTHLKNRGTEHHMKIKEMKEQVKQTNLGKYGTEYPAQANEIKEKTKQTNLEKYGVEYHVQTNESKERYKQNSLEKYGVINPLLSEEIKEKTKKTNLKKYGVEHIMQNSEMFEKAVKAGYKRKDFIFQDGTIIKLQGYEPIALQKLVDIGYVKDDIITGGKNVPEIWYIGKDNKKHRYYCDFYIKQENLIIEVKSTYTYKCKLEINQLKADACKNMGYNFEFWIIDKNQDIEIICN